MSSIAKAPAAQRLKEADENRESLAASAQEMADQMGALTPDLGFAAAAPGLAKHPLLVVTSNDGLQPAADRLVMDVKQRGGRVAVVHVATDHGYSDARIRLEAEVLRWLEGLK
jgi:hypothetical protein